MKRLFFFFIFSLLSLDVFAACIRGSGTAQTAATLSQCIAKIAASNPASGGRFRYCQSEPTQYVIYYQCTSPYDCPVGNTTCHTGNPDKGGVPVQNPADVASYETCHAQNKPFNPVLEQCEAACSVGSTVSPIANECQFTGCPVGHVQFGEMCKTIPEPEGDGQYVCDNTGCYWVDASEVSESTCTIKSKNYLGDFEGEAKCAYIDGEAYDQEDINDFKSGIGSCGAGYTEQWVNLQKYCLKGNETFSPDLPACEPPKIGIDGGCKYPPHYRSEKVNEGFTIGDGGTTKSQYIETETISTDRYGNSVTNTSVSRSDCVLEDLQWVCGEFVEVESSTIDDSDSEKSRVTGGQSCNDSYVCSGDAVQCASLAELHAIRCASEIDGDLPDQQPNTDFIDDYDFAGLNSEFSSGVDSTLTSLPSKYDTLANKYGGDSDLVTNVDLSEFVFDDVQLVTGSCPASFDFELGAFGVVAFDMTPFCTLLGYISYLVRLSASLFALRLTFATVSKL